MISLWLMLATARAHTLAMHLVEHDLQLRVHGDSVGLTHTLTVPIHQPEDRALLESPAQTVSGLLIEADGRPLPVTLRQSELVQAEKSHRSTLVVPAPLPAGTRTLRVSTASYPGFPTVLTWRSHFARQHTVLSSTLLPTDRRGVLRPAEDRRLVGDAWRVASWTLDAPAGPIERAWIALTPDQPAMRDLQAATARTWRASLFGASPLALGLGALLAGIAGAADDRTPSRLPGIVLVSWLFVLTLAPDLRWAAAVAFAGLVGIGLARAATLKPVLRAGLGVAGAAAFAFTAGGMLVAGFVWLAWALGRLGKLPAPAGAVALCALLVWTALRATLGPG